VADGTDAADARGDPGHLVERPAFGELLEAANLRDMKLGARHLAVFAEMNRDLGMAFDASYRIDRDAFHARLR